MIPLRRLVPVLLTVLSFSVPLASAGETAETEEQRRERMNAAWDEIARTFADDPDATLETANLPPELASRFDGDGDGTITGAEHAAALRRMSRPRDRSEFTHIEEGGFPLNVDPEIVAAGDAGLGDDDIVMGVVLGQEARAYPVNYMNGPYNEVVNDTLGGTAIAPSW